MCNCLAPSLTSPNIFWGKEDTRKWNITSSRIDYSQKDPSITGLLTWEASWASVAHKSHSATRLYSQAFPIFLISQHTKFVFPHNPKLKFNWFDRPSRFKIPIHQTFVLIVAKASFLQILPKVTFAQCLKIRLQFGDFFSFKIPILHRFLYFH